MSTPLPDPAAAPDPRVLRNALGAFATGVTVVTTRGAEGADVGLTANSFSSVSLDPPMVLWSLARTSSSFSAFRDASHFAVHVLSARQEAVSARFATKGVDKFAGLVLERGPGSIPMLPDCSARFACRTAYQYEGGDHIIFVGEVLAFAHNDLPPLVFHGGRYGTLIRKEAPPPRNEVGPATSPTTDDLIYHLSRAYFRIRRDAMAERKRRGLSELDYAVLSLLGHEDGRRVSELGSLAEARERRITPETVQDLAARGLVSAPDADGPDPDGRVRLTSAGRQAMIEIIAVLKAGEAEVLEDFDPGEVQLLMSLLRRIGG